MKNKILLLFFGLLVSPLFSNSPLTDAFTVGDPQIGSISALTFGPEGILFIGDSENAQVVAIDMGNALKAVNEKVFIADVEAILEQLLGSTRDQIQIIDLAVNPLNQNIYLGAQHSSGKSMLFLVNKDSLEPVSLDSVSFSKTNVANAVATDAKDRRGRSLRRWAISDLSYADGQLLFSGLNNAEFSSTFRSIPFPFSNEEAHSSLEIYHAAHGQYETYAPIKAFTTTTVNGKPHLIAGYTCTPLVIFPMEQMETGKHVKGRTVAELGNWNTPLDIIEMEKEGDRFILIANSSRALMKIKLTDIESFGDSLTQPVTERSGTAGVDFINLPFVNVQQLAKLNDEQFVMLQRQPNGKLSLKTDGNRWL